jgi:hypothetical protein
MTKPSDWQTIGGLYESFLPPGGRGLQIHSGGHPASAGGCGTPPVKAHHQLVGLAIFHPVGTHTSGRVDVAWAAGSTTKRNSGIRRVLAAQV